MKLLGILLSLIVLNSCDCYQTISGTITDIETNAPIEGASIKVKNNPSNNSMSDKDGKFDLSNITGGFKCPPMQVIVEHPDYKAQELTIPSGSVRLIQMEAKEFLITDEVILKDSASFYNRFWKDDEYVEMISLDFALVSELTLTDTSNSIIYRKPSYISILPHRRIIEKYQESMDEESWNTVLDDNMYYQSLAMEMLNARGIKDEYNDRNKRYLIFIKNDGKKIILDQYKFLHAWGFILFNGKDVPSFWSGTDISKAIEEVY